MKRRYINRNLLNKIQNYRVIDPETGEDKTHLVKLSPNYTDAQVKYAKRTNEIGNYTEFLGGFIWMIYQSDLKEKMTPSNTVRLMYLSTFLQYSEKPEDARLMNGKKGVMKDRDMKLLLMCSDRQFYAFKKEALASGALTFDGEAYRINKDYFTKGYAYHLQGRDLVFSRLYINSMRELYEKYGTARGVKQLAVLYNLLPYLHFETNILCKNPNETDINKLVPLTQKELAEILGYHEDKIRPLIRNLKLRDNFVFMDTRINGSTAKVINPSIIWKANRVPDKSLMALFGIAKRRFQ